MTSSTLLSRRALAAILVAGCLTAPTAMAQSADNGPSVKGPARANVYVPPSPDTSPDASETANVYVPPSPDTSPDASETANVYVPPARGGLPGAPQRPALTQTVAHAAVPSTDDGASPWAVIGLALGCAALLGGVGLALVHARRARRAVA